MTPPRPGGPILIALPHREIVASAGAGAIALTVSEFTRASAYRDRTVILGGADPGDFDLPYARMTPGGSPIRRLRQLWTRPSHLYADAIAEQARRCGAALVEVHNRAGLLRRLVDRLPADVPVSLHLHNDPQGMGGLRAPAERDAVLARAALICCVSDFVRTRFCEGLEATHDRVVVLHNGVVVPPAMPGPKRDTILFVGRFIPEKGVEVLIEALGQLADRLPGWRVRLIGRIPDRDRRRYRPALARLAALWGDRLAGPGTLSNAETMEAFAEAAITVVPSIWPEPFGRVAVEAMAAGSAVIASGMGGLREVVGDAGLLLGPVTSETLAAAIVTLAGDPIRRAALAEAGRAAALARFEVGLLARQLDARRERLLA